MHFSKFMQIFQYFQLLPIPTTVTNIPGRMGIAQNQLLFKSVLPPLGFNTYYFQLQSKLVAHVSPEARTNSHVQMTFNERCTLQNQVR